MQQKALLDRRKEVAALLREMQDRLAAVENEMKEEAAAGMSHLERAQRRIDLAHLKKLGQSIGANATYFDHAVQAMPAEVREPHRSIHPVLQQPAQK
jgi:hypothetical protein